MTLITIHRLFTNLPSKPGYEEFFTLSHDIIVADGFL